MPLNGRPCTKAAIYGSIIGQGSHHRPTSDGSNIGQGKLESLTGRPCPRPDSSPTPPLLRLASACYYWGGTEAALTAGSACFRGPAVNARGL